MPNRVLVCSNYYPPTFIGGAELIAHQQALTLRELGWEVVVFAGDPPGKAARYTRRRETFEGLRVHRVGLAQADFDPEFANFSQPAVEREFEAVLDAERPDVVHFHNLIGLSIGLIRVARRRGLKTALTVHDHWGICHKNTLMKRDMEICTDHTRCAECLPLIEDGAERHLPIRLRRDFLRLQLEQADTIIAPSQYLADFYVRAGFARERVEVIWYGIDVARFAKVRKTPGPILRFSFIGHLGAHKGVRTLVDALALLPDVPGARVNLVGDGVERGWCERRVRELGLEHSVRFWGQIDNARIEEVYGETDVLVLPSVWPENQPVCLTEAMASRTAVIASRIGGIPELIEDGRNGYLFEPGDAHALARCMSELMRNPPRVIEFGEEGFRRIADQTLSRQVAKIVRAYGRPSRPAGDTQWVGERLFVCAGEHVDLECALAMNALSRQGDRSWRFVVADWLDDAQIAEAKALWVVDRKAGVESVLSGLRNGVPLLVPEDNAELRELCVYGRCGLYYRDAPEAIRCLAYLAEHEQERGAMARHGREVLLRPWRLRGPAAGAVS